MNSVVASSLLAVCLLSATCSESAIQKQAAEVSASKRPVTVADFIHMNRLANPNYLAGAWAKPRVAEFSPDGRRFVIVLRKGNLEDNTNEYSLLLFHTTKVFLGSAPESLLTLASSSNRPAIQDVTWLDNDTIAFLGERPGEHQQLFTFLCRTKELKFLTRHSTNVAAYSLAKLGGAFAFVAETPRKKAWTEKERRDGILVTTQWIFDLIAGENRERLEDNELFVKEPSSGVVKRVQLHAPLATYGSIRLSPNGRYLLVMTLGRNVPEEWGDYTDADLRKQLSTKLPNGVLPFVMQYTLVDTQSGENHPLIEAPLGTWGTEAAWSPDSRSVIVTDTYLPLTGISAPERTARLASTYVVEVRVPSRENVKFPTGDLRLIRWDASSDKAIFQKGRMNAVLGKDVPKVAYQAENGVWKESDVSLEAEEPIEVHLEEDLNTPPRILVRDPKAEKRSLLLDLNPQFGGLSLAHVEHVRWKGTDGHEVDGGLYLPPDYVPGKKYPLILQTHGFNPKRFWMDGPWTTAFAAQAFASKGFVVLQVNDWPDIDQWPKISVTEAEGPYQRAAFEGAIEYLDSRGLIDRSRVGIIGFSRSCFYLKFSLTHSQYPFAAAAVTDGVDAGYVQYMLQANRYSTLESDRMNGAPPFGEGLSSWLRLSPGFNLHKVQTPIRLEALGPASVLFEWEWFAGLSRLGKPVELIFQPGADHIIEKPWERLVSQQGNVDWFSFWLKGEEDPDPAKKEQYKRWRELRKLHEANQATKRPN